MGLSKIDGEELISTLTEVFRLHGFQGASLSRIVAATGLQRASLYHRFPGGKDEMALAVLKRADRWFGEYILAPLSEPGTAASRVRKMAARLDEFYSGGERSCLLDTLSMGQEETSIRQHVEGSFCAWRDALVGVAREAGLSARAARWWADEALVGIQGALVLARATGDNRAFKRVLKDLPKQLISPSDSG